MRVFISNLLRKFGILFYTDKIRFYIHYIKRRKLRQKFIKENPHIALPPAYLVYESFDLNFETYYHASKKTTSWLLDHFRKHIELKNINILDWGCGPGRIVRHIPELLDATCSVYGTDYNPKSISWCRKMLPGINFNLNSTEPPLPYVDHSFDIIYGISIFTHLPEDLHYKWFNELVRISKDGGILFLTLHGKAFKAKLTREEQIAFDSGQILVKGNTKVGHRTFAAFHPDTFVKVLIGINEVLEHIKGEITNGKPQQDIWIIRIKKSGKM